jgi:serine/threonine protein kinase
MSAPNDKDSATTFGDQLHSQPSAPRLKGRYRIERELGRGGVGVVFLARDERLHGMPVVIKFMLDAAEQNQWLASKFSQEAEALTRINHPGVVRVIDRDLTDDGHPFFVMEFIKGRPLRELLVPEPMDLARVARIVRQTGSALHAAHQQGVFHRDLKPENIMLEQLGDGDEQVKLIDFGIAKVTNPQAGAETEVAVVAGSRQYIAPEQLLSQTASPATDIYALAIIVYEMVTGRLPFNPQGPTHFLVMQELMRLQQSESFVKPQTFRPDLPEAAQILLSNALSFDPRRRPQNARIFTDDLAQALTGRIGAADARATIAIPAPDSDRPHARDTLPMEHVTTELSSIPAKSTGVSASVRHSSPNLAPNQTSPIIDARTPTAKPKVRKLPIIAGLIIVGAAAAGIAFSPVPQYVKTYLNPGAVESPTPQATEPAASQTSTPEAATPDPATEAVRTFNYSITLRKDPKRYPDSAPFQIPGEVVFSPDDRVHFSFISPQPGFLYIINESPPAKGQTSSGFNILFPSPTANQGSAQVSAGQTVRIPDHDIGFVFDAEQGTEKLWFIWAAAEVAELEPLKRWANPQDVGEVKDAAQVEILRAFLATHSTTEPQVTRNDTSKQTMVKMKGDILVKLVNLQHY